MMLPLHIARRYLFARKSHHAINVISVVSFIGVMVSSMALFMVMSVFNGFSDLIMALYGVFDPDVKITLREGRTFRPDSLLTTQLRGLEAVAEVSETLEEQVLLGYGERTTIQPMKGVDDHHVRLTGLDTLMYSGVYSVADTSEAGCPDAVLGMNVAATLQIGLRIPQPIQVYMLRRQAAVSFSPERAVRKAVLRPAGIFSIEEESDNMVLVPLRFMQQLLERPGEVSAIEVRLRPGTDSQAVCRQIRSMWGDDWLVRTRFEQKELVYKIMRSEKWAGFMILTFILIIASFNVVASLTMLMLEKKQDARTLAALGADTRFIRRIFRTEGVLISFSGALAGLLLGVLCCFLQQQFGLVRLAATGTFIIDAYPVSMRFSDFLWILLTVVLTGTAASFWPVRRFFKHISMQ